MIHFPLQLHHITTDIDKKFEDKEAGKVYHTWIRRLKGRGEEKLELDRLRTEVINSCDPAEREKYIESSESEGNISNDGTEILDNWIPE